MDIEPTPQHKKRKIVSFVTPPFGGETQQTAAPPSFSSKHEEDEDAAVFTEVTPHQLTQIDQQLETSLLSQEEDDTNLMMSSGGGGFYPPDDDTSSSDDEKSAESGLDEDGKSRSVTARAAEDDDDDDDDEVSTVRADSDVENDEPPVVSVELEKMTSILLHPTNRSISLPASTGYDTGQYSLRRFFHGHHLSQ